jgi:hypothetical protein
MMNQKMTQTDAQEIEEVEYAEAAAEVEAQTQEEIAGMWLAEAEGKVRKALPQLSDYAVASLVADLLHAGGDEVLEREILRDATKDEAKTYEADHAGKKVRVTVPENEDPSAPGKELRDLLQDCMSPEAVATIAFAVNVHLARGGTTGMAYQQADWFQIQLVALLGGQDAYERVCRETGLLAGPTDAA